MTDTDAWKGEHLIRNMKPAHKGGATTGRKNRSKKQKAHSICAYPGCNIALPKSNRSLVCRVHLHDDRYCGCKLCFKRKVK